MVSESVHPQLRLSFPGTSKILAGLTAWIVNKMFTSVSINDGLEAIFGSTEMLAHASQNVGSMATATEYPGNLFLLMNYIPTEDKVIKFQIAVTVEYIMTEILALAGGVAERLQDQPQFKKDVKDRVKYEDFPTIRPSDVKTAIMEDNDLRAAFGSLFK